MALRPSPTIASSTALTSHKLPSLAPIFFLLPSEERRSGWWIRPRIAGRGAVLACSAKKPSGGGKRQRSSRTNLSDSDLREELLRFVLVEGFPEGHVPSTSELAEGGRKDLANMVRRRGYKTISELLGNQRNESKLTKKCLSKVTDPGDKVNSISSEAQDEGSCVSSETINGRGASSGTVSPNYSNNGEFVETIELSEPPVSATDAADQSTHFRKKSLAGDAEDALTDLPDFPSIDRHHVPEPAIKLGTGKDSEITESGFSTSADPEFRNEANLGQNVINDDDNTRAGDSFEQTQIDDMRIMLQQKEMELLQLRQEIEKETLALSCLQNKAATEMGFLQNLICQSDVELSATEESLLGLKEVLIEYNGHGETVEVAGSFNGWQHRIKLNSQSSVNMNSGERGGNCWKATLWLYPGIYEIKFIVDGNWKTDPHRESVTRGHITNNIIRIER